MGKVINFPVKAAAADGFYITAEDAAAIERVCDENIELRKQVNEFKAQELAQWEREERQRRQELILPPLAWIRKAPVASVVFVMLWSSVIALVMMHIRLMALAG